MANGLPDGGTTGQVLAKASNDDYDTQWVTGGGGSSPLTTKGDLYTRDSSADTRLPVGLDTQVLIADSTTTTGLKWGSNTAPTPLGYYGAWQDDQTQTAPSSNTGVEMIYRVQDVTPNGVSIVNNGSGNPTRITFANTGIYNIQFSSQFQNSDVQEHDVTIWLRKNGLDVPGSSGFVAVVSSHGGTPGHVIASWNYVLEIVGGDYYELVWSTTDHVDVTMQYYAAGSPPPAAASVILTVTQQSGIMAGTGITAINSLTGSVQTLSTGTSGTDFAISSVGTSHTFNIPTASSVNRGLLSTSDWSTFNGKQPQLNGTGFVKASGTTISYDNSVYLTEDPAVLGQQAMGSTIKGICLAARSFRDLVGGLQLVSGTLYLTTYYLAKSETITGVKFYQQTQGNFTANNFNGFALFTYSAGVITRVAITANDGNNWKFTSGTTPAIPFTSPYSASSGLYFIGGIYSNTLTPTTVPIMGHGGTKITSGAANADFTNTARFTATLTGQASMPSSITLSTTTALTTNIAFYLY
jgi:hypothetical protein